MHCRAAQSKAIRRKVLGQAMSYEIGDEVVFGTSDFFQNLPGVIQQGIVVALGSSAVKLRTKKKWLFLRWESERWHHCWDIWGKVEKQSEEVAALERLWGKP